MNIKTGILRELKKTKEYISGQALCEKFGVSRTAVWKVINQLKEEGYDIASVTNKGYILNERPDILSTCEIESELEDGFVTNILYYDEIDSTNTKAKLLGEEGAPTGTLVVSDCQLSGKGRRGKSFDSPAGQSIYMTILLRPDIEPYKASMLTIITAMAVRNSLEEVCGIKGGIKWPNDIVVQGKKLCGILTEMSAELMQVNYVVVGIGINVNNDDMPQELSEVAVSAKMITGRKWKRSSIIARVMHWFGIYYDRFMQTKDLSGIRDEYNSYLINYNDEIVVIKEKDSYSAIARGLAEDGELIIERDGHLEKIMSGEVSVRGVYGYGR